MAPTDGPTDTPDGETCAPGNSFSPHGIEKGSALLQQTYYTLRETDTRPGDERFPAHLESAFRWAYLGLSDERGVPAHVEAALADALHATATSFSDSPDADLRTEVVPTFYRTLARFHCAYRK